MTVDMNAWLVYFCIFSAAAVPLLWLALMSLISAHTNKAKATTAYYDELTRKEKLDR